jgi:hypothetical protein
MFEKCDKILFDNTKTESFFDDSGEISAYRITPVDGYVIHTSLRDEAVIDEETGMETGEVKKGYTASYILIQSNYDFEDNPYDIYAILKEEAGDAK